MAMKNDRNFFLVAFVRLRKPRHSYVTLAIPRFKWAIHVYITLWRRDPSCLCDTYEMKEIKIFPPSLYPKKVSRDFLYEEI